jgi:hypothetical protein
MKILTDDAIHLKLLLNIPIHVEGIGNFHAPNLPEIVDLTEEIYNMSLSTIFFDKNRLEETKGLEEYTNFEVLLSIINQDDSFRELFFYGLNLHLDVPVLLHSSGLIYFDEFSEESILTEDKFDYIKNLVKIANNVSDPKEEEYKPGNERARKFLEKIKQQRAEIEKVKKPKMNLHSIISAVGWKAQSFKFINDLTIYQLYEGFRRLEYMDNYKFTMTGIYTGNIDGTKIKLPDINWANIIK